MICGGLSRGLPPLARRERLHDSGRYWHPRSTSARAERTCTRSATRSSRAVYLRSRGENPDACADGDRHEGLPPLARRERSRSGGERLALGSTSARAERTSPAWRSGVSEEVYLRSRGENSYIPRSRGLDPGLPPLARRERLRTDSHRTRRRSTSARAERTAAASHALPPPPVYLRSRGENALPAALHARVQGLPPLARRELRRELVIVLVTGSTSARAERTPSYPPQWKERWVYLRSRGENAELLLHLARAPGLPPLARRELQHLIGRYLAHGSTSARAERTP